eukprot:TRINITY_DN1662_c0_g1_i2.p1 TRINITY_DN1662_c0_g1~~TRINITY_DN1662_c0_g1_i2.p1  ORF type:complete len:189 (+),score=53.66 TRINITY_DN1662_c0_g1_i2:104-670(+)
MESQLNNEPFGCTVYAPPAMEELPYNWDGDCHLIVNSKFYAHSRHPSDENSPHTPGSLDFDVDFPQPCQLMNDCDPEVQSLDCTMVTGSTANTERMEEEKAGEEGFERCKTLDAQLEFIMGRCKRSKDNQKNKKTKRSRKTQEQLEILSNEFEQDRSFGKDRVRALAEKTGLSEMQVYKWFWDRNEKS